MQIQRRLVALLLCSAVATWAQGNSFDKVRYNDGSVDSIVDPRDWHNQLTVSSDMITLALNDSKNLEIRPKTVTALSYGQETHRRVGTMIALAIVISPVALFGLLHKTRLHFTGIQYTLPDTKTGGILLQGDKDNQRAILVALQGVTAVRVSVDEGDHGFVPVSVRTEVTKSEQEQAANETGAEGKAKESKPVENASAQPAIGTVSVSSNPPGADVFADDDFVGNSPAALKLAPGKHTIAVKMSGYADWAKAIMVQSGSEVQLNAT